MNDKKLTVKQVKTDLALVGIRIRKTDAGDFRVAHSLTEAGGYYTSDLADALATGKAMARDRARTDKVVKAAQAAGPVALLRHHVSGAIARGEGVAVTEQRETFAQYLASVGSGSRGWRVSNIAAADYAKASARITELETLVAEMVKGYKWTLLAMPDIRARSNLRDTLADAEAALTNQFQHLEG